MTAVLKRCITIDTDDVERVGNEVVKMIDNFKNKNGRLPNGLDELGTPFIGNNETYEYRGYIFITNLKNMGSKKTVIIGFILHLVLMRITFIILGEIIGYGIMMQIK